MKKSIIILILLLIPLLLIGCDKGGEASTDAPTDKVSEKPTEPEESVEIPEDAVLLSTEAGLRVLYADGCFDGANLIYGKLMDTDPKAYDHIGYYTMLRSDKSYADDGKIEILVGMTGKDASEKSRESLETYLDYTVSVIDGSIVINSHSSERLGEAVDYFLSRVKLIGDSVVYLPEKKENIGKYTDYTAPDVDIAGVALSEFSFVYPKDANEYELAAVRKMIDWIGKNTGAIISMRDDSTEREEYEILMGKTSREASEQIFSTLAQDEYLFTFVNADGGIDIVIAYYNVITMNKLVEQIGSEISDSGKVPEEIRGEIKEDRMIVSQIPQLRDPCILLEDGVYYAYGTGWVCYKNTSGDLAGEWKSLGRVVTVPEDATDCYWAPEVHKYNGAFYMFTTYKSSKNGHRGCTVLRADRPEGPFVEISDGHVTPSDWDAIDGTLYVDEEGTPWMIFVHEWTSTPDGIGRMAAAKMSDDLSKFIS